MIEFVEVKTADLVGAALDWAVAKAVGQEIQVGPGAHQMSIEWFNGIMHAWSASNNWHQCGPLIDKFRVSIIYSDEVCDPCAWTDSSAAWHATTPLIAVCRAIVASVLGGTVSVPKELLS